MAQQAKNPASSLLWLFTVVAQVQSQAWECLHAAGAAQKHKTHLRKGPSGYNVHALNRTLKRLCPDRH